MPFPLIASLLARPAVRLMSNIWQQGASRKRKADVLVVSGAKKMGPTARKKARLVGGSASVARAVYAAAPVPVRRSYQLINDEEWKAVDFDGVQGPTSATNSNTSFNYISTIAQGAAGYQRVGRCVNYKYLALKFSLIPNVANVSIQRGNYCIAVVLDLKPNGTVPNFNAVFQAISSAGAATSTFDSPVNLDNTDRFRILARKTGTTPDIGDSTSPMQNIIFDTPAFAFDRYISLRDQKACWSGATGAIGECTEGAIYVVYLSTQSTSASNWFNLQYSARIRYVD